MGGGRTDAVDQRTAAGPAIPRDGEGKARLVPRDHNVRLRLHVPGQGSDHGQARVQLEELDGRDLAEGSGELRAAVGAVARIARAQVTPVGIGRQKWRNRRSRRKSPSKSFRAGPSPLI